MNIDRLFENLDNLEVGKWYGFHTNSYGKEFMIDLIKYRIDLRGDFLISNDYKSFKKIINPLYLIPLNDSLSFTIEFIDHDISLFEYNMEVKIKRMDKKEFDRRSGRK